VGSGVGLGSLVGDLAGVIEGEASGGVEEPGEVVGGRDEGVDDVQGGEEIFVEVLEVADDLVVGDHGVAELVGIFAEAIARRPAGAGEDRGGEAGGVGLSERC